MAAPRPTSDPRSGEHVLLVRSASRTCALPLRDVAETMRPLPIAQLPGVPEPVLGAAVVRGVPAAVVLLRAVLGEPAAPPSRFVAIRLDQRLALLAVDAVIGVSRLAKVQGVPLLSSAAGGAVEALAALDRTLVAVLDAARLVPDGAWAAVVGGGGGAPVSPAQRGPP